jgi:hypothetical protein
MEKIRIRDPGWEKFGSGIGINILDPQHCREYREIPIKLILSKLKDCPSTGQYIYIAINT